MRKRSYSSLHPDTLTIPHDLFEVTKSEKAEWMLNPVAAIDEEGNFALLHHLDIIPGPRKTDSLPVYIKAKSFDTYNKVIDNWKVDPSKPVIDGIIIPKFNLVVITGPPGCGKTTVATCLCSRLAEDSEEKTEIIIYWESVEAKSARFCFQGGKITRVTDETVRNARLEEARWLFFDGMTKEKWPSYQDLIEEATTVRNQRVLVVSSYQLTIKQSYLDRVNGREHKCFSWSIQDYYTAVQNDEFFNSVAGNLDADPGLLVIPFNEVALDLTPERYRQRLIDAKYGIAGGCARWMFDYNTEKVIDQITEAIQALPSVDALVNSDVGQRSTQAVNKLSSLDGSKAVVVSDYAIRLLFQKTNVEKKFIVQAYHMLRGDGGRFNPSLDGWILEMDCLFCIKEDLLANKVKFTVNNNSRDLNAAFDSSFASSSVVYFHSSSMPTADLEAKITEFKTNMWFIPMIFNQGGFDFVQFIITTAATAKLRFVQVTRSLTHEMKIYYMVAFANKIVEILRQRNAPWSLTALEIVMLIPTELIASAPLTSEWKITGNPRKEGQYGYSIERKLAAWQRTQE
jgi:DNA polymerase III delta prime subunit